MVKDESLYLAIVDDAFDMFNRQMRTDYSRDNIEVKLIDAKSADKEISKFLENYPEVIEEQMLEPGYYRSIRAEAFVSSDRKGMILRTDTGEHDLAWRHLVLHELCHIYAVTHELDGANFYKKYCIDYAEGEIQDGIINAGYAIWREFVAEFFAHLLDEDLMDGVLDANVDHLEWLLDDIEDLVDDAKYCVSAVLIDLFTTREVMQEPDIEGVLALTGQFDRLSSENWKGIIQIIYEQIFREEFYKIDIDFISELGSYYISLKTELYMKKLGI